MLITPSTVLVLAIILVCLLLRQVECRLPSKYIKSGHPKSLYATRYGYNVLPIPPKFMLHPNISRKEVIHPTKRRRRRKRGPAPGVSYPGGYGTYMSPSSRNRRPRKPTSPTPPPTRPPKFYHHYMDDYAEEPQYDEYEDRPEEYDYPGSKANRLRGSASRYQPTKYRPSRDPPTPPPERMNKYRGTYRIMSPKYREEYPPYSDTPSPKYRDVTPQNYRDNSPKYLESKQREVKYHKGPTTYGEDDSIEEPPKYRPKPNSKYYADDSDEDTKYKPKLPKYADDYAEYPYPSYMPQRGSQKYRETHSEEEDDHDVRRPQTGKKTWPSRPSPGKLYSASIRDNPVKVEYNVDHFGEQEDQLPKYTDKEYQKHKTQWDGDEYITKGRPKWQEERYMKPKGKWVDDDTFYHDRLDARTITSSEEKPEKTSKSEPDVNKGVELTWGNYMESVGKLQ